MQANYKETQVRHIRAGDPAEIRVDALPGSDLQRESRSSLSRQRLAVRVACRRTMRPATSPKIVQRVPVKIVLDPGQAGAERLRPGLSVIATVRTNGAGQ